MTISYSYYAESDTLAFESLFEGCFLCRTSLYLVDNVTALKLEQENSDTKTIEIAVLTEGKAIIRTWMTNNSTLSKQIMGPDTPFDVACNFFWNSKCDK